MKNPVKFIENSGDRLKFYETVLEIKLTICDSCETEKMAFFSDFSTEPNVAISWIADFRPSKDGVLVSLNVESIEATLTLINANGGKTVRKKTKIEADDMGDFAKLSESEGNTFEFYAYK